MNHFGSSYSILHDSDTPKTKKGDKNNPAWGNNPNILAAVKAKPDHAKVRLLASLPNFEKAYFQKEVEDEKPYNALRTIQVDPEKFATVERLLIALINHEKELPDNCFEWDNIDKLREKVEKN